ncbi:Hybrid signal transduction histidine kinase K [Elsinoe australis]|uniref:histidine kinase n=1 Tax=Elsinoe australis TaxID=40998 RepID=A0A2P7YFR6_9PEZI|nr:Hybrid signal transduction histidine kinase K [Elsinoe australis]
MIYNERFVEFAGQKHPRLMGSTPVIEYAEVWDTMFAAIIKRGKEKREATRHKDVQLFLHRHGYLEEVFVTYTFVPILGADASVVGFYHTAVETTEQVLAMRRTHTLLGIGNHTTSARSIKDYWAALLAAFESNPQDVPYVAAFEFKELSEDISARSSSTNNKYGPSSTASSRVPRSCGFVGAVRIPITGIPMSLEALNDQDHFSQAVRKCISTGQATELNRDEHNLPDWLCDINHESSPDATKCNSAVVVPIRPTARDEGDGQNAIGFIVLGLNPHRKYEETYERYVHLWGRQMATSAASVVLLEQEIRRQEQLAIQLSISAKTQRQTQARFSRFAELADVAMWIVDGEDQVIYANRAWREQTQLHDEIQMASDWIKAVAPDSRATVEKAWKRVVEEKCPQVFEAQLTSPKAATDDAASEKTPKLRWILCSAFPEVGEGGTLESVWACNTDISHQKWAEALVEQRLSDVLETKRQSENFIDMTSHEMRNPLSAIMQCADGIVSSLNDMLTSADQTTPAAFSQSTINVMLEMAQTIVLCAQHQNRIVNDILTLSKLDASLLTVTLVATDPIGTLESALKLHQRELLNAGITGSLIVEDSYKDLGIGGVFLDPSRLLQLLINLVANAIKFTQFADQRKISLRLGASLDNPAAADDHDYFVGRSSRVIAETPNQLVAGMKVYLNFAVEDTGCGLNEEERQRLFLRFSQANQRTHVQYGGSGLGLFICKEIVELCGGRIGVTSQPGKGSTFKFFLPVQTAPVETPPINQSAVWPILTPSGRGTAIASDVPHATQVVGRQEEMPDAPIPTAITQPTEINNHSSKTKPSHTETELHILVVEDNLINQKVMANQLRKLGAAVYVADHGLDALAFLDKTHFSKDASGDSIPLSVVLLDSEMPVMDGLTCIKYIRERQQTGIYTKWVPVVGVTANARPEQVKKAMDAGMDEVATKPVRIATLMEQIRELLSRER